MPRMPRILHILPIVLLAFLALPFTASVGGCATPGSRGTPPTSAGSSPTDTPLQDKITTFLMFEGDAEQAMNFYLSLFDDAKVIAIDRYGPDEPTPEGSFKLATFTLAGRSFMVFDSPAPHPFTFTPSVSLFVTCRTERELERLYAALSEGGQVLMPLNDYGFSRRYAWVNDRFGVSWQLNLPHE